MTRIATILILATIYVMSALPTPRKFITTRAGKGTTLAKVSTVKQSLTVGPPAPVMLPFPWTSCDWSVSFFRVYTSTNHFNWDLYSTTTDLSVVVTCDQPGAHFFRVKAVNAYGESDWGTKGNCP